MTTNGKIFLGFATLVLALGAWAGARPQDEFATNLWTCGILVLIFYGIGLGLWPRIRPTFKPVFKFLGIATLVLLGLGLIGWTIFLWVGIFTSGSPIVVMLGCILWVLLWK